MTSQNCERKLFEWNIIDADTNSGFEPLAEYLLIMLRFSGCGGNNWDDFWCLKC